MALLNQINTEEVSWPLSAPIPFESFMRYCLYDACSGYYFQDRSKIFGRNGDYFTSPSMHHVFARCLSQFLFTCFDQMGKPCPFHVCELGSGDGRLAKDILSYVNRDFQELSRAIDYVEIDVDRGELPERIKGVVFSNEFFDSLPVHRGLVDNEEFKEVYVHKKKNGFEESFGPISDLRIVTYLEKGFPRFENNWIYEVNLHMLEILKHINEKMEKGFILTIDYGYTLQEYDSVPRPNGTLVCYHQHQIDTNPYKYIGEKDLTCHIHWGILEKAGANLGWRSQQVTTQRNFLVRNGLEEHLLNEENIGRTFSECLESRLGLKQLLLPGGISDTLGVLVQEVRCF